MKLIGQIASILFEDDGFFVARLASGEKISGHYHDSSIESIDGAAVTLEGEFVDHPKYAKTFRFQTLIVNQHPLFFFLNRVVKGFPKKVTAELIERFGEEGLVEILDNDIETLAQFSGITSKRLARIQSRWKQFRSMRELGTFLAPFGVTPSLLSTIAGGMKAASDPVGAIRKNPYILTRVEGVGFLRADALALQMGMDPRDERRIASAMDYALARRCEREGNSCIEKAALFRELETLLKAAAVPQLFEPVLAERIADGSIHLLGDTLLSPQRLYEAEQFISREFRRRGKLRDAPLVTDLDTFLQAHTFTPGEEQRSAIELLNEGHRLLCLVGYAGTGKSTTARMLLQLLGTRYGEIITCALSGIASQRIGEVSGFESATIQSLLVRFESRDVLPYQVVLIDEASMINAPLFARLLAKCHRDAVIIIVGDDAQLPPIGAGDVLGDIIRYDLMPVVKLTRIYRQSDDQAIAVIANAIRRATMPVLDSAYDDFRFEALDVSAFPNRDAHMEAVLHALVRETMAAIPDGRRFLKTKALHDYLTHFQVITPMKGGALGTENLNRVLQPYFNPSPKQSVVRGERRFALMDKVVHTKNDNLPSWTLEGYKDGEPSEPRRIFNGMIGLLFRIDEEAQQAYVVYPLEATVVCYDFGQLTIYLMLAYALTIHKVQGMEYRRVALPLVPAHAVMLDKKLLYTAVTRAREHCSIIGDFEAFARAVHRNDGVSRRTVLQFFAAR